MIVQTERIYLFETEAKDPYFFGTVDGVTATMADERRIDFLDINTVYFFIDTVSKGGLQYTKEYGGEDVGLFDTAGKVSTSYRLEFNLPLLSQRTIDAMMGREFSILAMRRDLTYFCIFGRFVAQDLEVDNEVLQRVTMQSSANDARIFEVNSFNITNILNNITTEDPSGDLGGFEYALEEGMDS
jgi:hypothetical protein